MLTYLGHKVTANELAKIFVADRGLHGCEFWGEILEDDIEFATKKEKAALGDAIEKHEARLIKFFGFRELTTKVYARPDRTEKINKKRYL